MFKPRRVPLGTIWLIAALFASLAVIGFKRNLWRVAVALAAHGVLDFFHHLLVHNTGVPRGWPGFCLAFDLTSAGLVGCVLALRVNRSPQALNHGGPGGLRIERWPSAPPTGVPRARGQEERSR